MKNSKLDKDYQNRIKSEIVKKGKLTVSEAASQTGVPVLETEYILQQLIYRYKCRLAVTADGNLIYDFSKNLTRIGELTENEQRKEIRQLIKKILRSIAKVIFALFLLLYSLSYVILLIISIFNLDKKNKNKLSLGEQFIDTLIPDVFIPTKKGKYIYKKDNYNHEYKEYIVEESFISSIFNFVFGKQQPKTNILEDQKEIIAYIHQNKGIIVQSEIKALTGWSSAKCEDFFMDCLRRFNGEPKISEKGIFYGDFTKFVTGQAKPTTKITWFWDEYEPEYQLTANSIKMNIGILFINAPIIMYSVYLFAREGMENYLLALTLLSIVPFIFSILFFIIPAIRYFKLIPLKKQRLANNLKKELSLIIFKEKGNDLKLKDIQQQLKTTQKLPNEQVKRIMQDLILEWSGELIVDENAQLIYMFPKLKTEINEVEQLRQQKEAIIANNEIIFETQKAETVDNTARKTEKNAIPKREKLQKKSRGATIFRAILIRIVISIAITAAIIGITGNDVWLSILLPIGIGWVFAAFFRTQYFIRMVKIAGVGIILYLTILPTCIILMALYLKPIAIGLVILAPWIAFFKAISIVK